MADGSVTIDVTLTKDQLEKGLKQVKSDINGLSKTGTVFKSIGGAISSMGSAMQKAGKVIIGATAGIVAGLGTAVGRFDTLKNYPKVMQNLGFTAKQSQKSINDLSEGIDGLPTALDDATKGVKKLASKNGDIEKSTKYFLAMNDAIIAGGESTETQAAALRQLLQAYTKGKPEMEDWNTIMDGMSGQMRQVAKSMGYVDTNALYDALKKGKISMDEFMDAIVKLDRDGGKGIVSFKEQAMDSADGLGTALTNVKNRINKGFAAMLKGLDELASGTRFKSLGGMVNAFSSSIGKFLSNLGDALKKSKSAKKFIEDAGSALEKLQQKVENISSEQVDKLVNAFITLAKAGPALLIFGKLFSIIGGGITQIGGLVETVGNLKGAFAGAGAGASAMSGAMAGAGASTGALSGALSALASPAGIIIAVILAVVAVLVILYKKSEKFRNAVNEAFGQIKEALLSAWETIKPALEELWSALQELWTAIQPIVSFVIDVLVVAVKILAEVLAQIIPVIAQIITWWIKFQVAILQNVITAITSLITFFTVTLPTALNNFVTNVQTFVGNVIKFFKNLPYNIGIMIGNIIKFFINLGINLWNFVTTKIPQIVNGIINWFKQLPGKIWTFLTNVVKNIGTWIGNMKTKVTTEVPKVVDKIKEFFEKLPDKMLEIGKNIVDGIWKGISGAGDWIKQKVGEFAKDILQGMKDSLGIESPSKVFRDEVGKNIALGVGEGFNKNIQSIYKQMKSKVEFETQKLSANLSTTASFNKSIVANININGDVDLDGNKVGRFVAPSVSRTLRTAGV